MKFTNLQDAQEHWILSQEEKEIVHELQIIPEPHFYTDVPDKTHLQELVRQKITFSSFLFRLSKGSSQWSESTWDPSSMGAWVELDNRVQAAGPDTVTQTCYCPWAFKHRLVWSGRPQRRQMKASIINRKVENDYLQEKMSPGPL